MTVVPRDLEREGCESLRSPVYVDYFLFLEH